MENAIISIIVMNPERRTIWKWKEMHKQTEACLDSYSNCVILPISSVCTGRYAIDYQCQQ